MTKIDYKSQIEQLEATVETLTIDIAVKNSKISELTTENNNLSNTVRTQEEEITSKAQDYALNTQKLTDKVTNITRDYQSQREALQHAREQIKKSGEELAVLHENYDKANGYLEGLRYENVNLFKQNDLLTESNRQADLVVEKLESKLEIIEEQLKKTSLFNRIFRRR